MNNDIAKDAAEDELMIARALLAIVIEQKTEISVSFLQRRFPLGYLRAIQYIDSLAEMGVVEMRDPTTGTRPIKVLLTRATAADKERIAELERKLSVLPADWSEDSSLETWFPMTADEVKSLRAQLAAKTQECEGLRWIPVEERKPADNEEVLIYFTERNLGVQLGGYVGGLLDEWRPHGTNSNFEASHWMPLPAPPNSARKEGE